MNRTALVLIGITVAIMAAAIALVILPGKTVAPTATPASKDDLIRVTSPLPEGAISSPLVVSGEARGNWYFEASFPIELRNAAGAMIAQGYAQAEGEWMTTEYVPFTSVPLTFTTQPSGSTGTLILRKDNPSGLPEHDNSLEIPVTF
ncbi:hypothetical protein IT396_01735 [Candidatus Nomurabacteria bacterium]|nr:hypothetical protein [Candidatus Nomurabacteria bacterium]